MRILYFGMYDPGYARNYVIIEGLRSQGFEVIECNDRSPGLRKYWNLILRHWKLRKSYDVMIVGFPGQEMMFLAKVLSRKPIIFDVFTSHYGGYVLDRKTVAPHSFRAQMLRFLDTWSCKMADRVLLDTQAHIDFFVKEFRLSSSKFRRIWIGANEHDLQPGPVSAPAEKTRVLFFGTFIPLQGIETILKAAQILAREPFSFTLVGKGQLREKMMIFANTLALQNVRFVDSVPHDKLREYMLRSDICLGIFGDTPKTPLVIPNKVYESLAMRKPTVTADTPAIRELFSEDDMMLVPAADPQALAESLRRLAQDADLREYKARHGYETFRSKASIQAIGKLCADIIIAL